MNWINVEDFLPNKQADNPSFSYPVLVKGYHFIYPYVAVYNFILGGFVCTYPGTTDKIDITVTEWCYIPN